LAEGLYALLHTGSGTAEATRDYWNKFLATRKKFLEDIIGRTDSVVPDMGQNIVRAVQTAMLCLMQVQPQTCEDYVAAWRTDLQEWAERLKILPKVGSVEAALEVLALTSIQCDYPVIQASPSTAYGFSDILDTFLAHKAVSNLLHSLLVLALACRWQWIERFPQAPRGKPSRSQKHRATSRTQRDNTGQTRPSIGLSQTSAEEAFSRAGYGAPTPASQPPATTAGSH